MIWLIRRLSCSPAGSNVRGFDQRNDRCEQQPLEAVHELADGEVREEGVHSITWKPTHEQNKAKLYVERNDNATAS